ncbi:MAG: hypothetical protein GWP06_18160, partial [Actinobacteria bacterium]|nr:hypothetical protein [Actinomycetota bacterium]
MDIKIYATSGKVFLILFLLGISTVSYAVDERPEIMFGRGNDNPKIADTSQTLPMDPWKAPRKVDFQKIGNDIHVYLKTATLIFNGSTANIQDAKVIGTQMVETPQPNLVVVSPDGTVYSQNRSTKGKIDAYDDGEYINVFGRFTLTSEDSRTFQMPDVWYKIDKNNGYTQVRYNLWGNVYKADPPVEIMKLYVDTIVGNIKYNKVEHFWQGCGVRRENESDWEPWANFKADISQDRVFVSDKIVNMMMVNNARMGFATEPITFEGLSTEKGLDGYMAYLAKDNQHVFRYTFINHKAAPYKLIMPYEIQFTMAYLPTREYRRPKMKFFTGAWVEFDECARVGIDTIETWGKMGWPFDKQASYDTVMETNKKIHHYGLKHTHFCVNWYPLNGPNPRYPEPYGETAKRDQAHTFGRYFTWSSDPNTPYMCLNSKGWFDNYYENAVHNIVDFDGDGIRMDCSTPLMCRNTLHGCSEAYSTETLAYYKFCKKLARFYKSMSEKNGREYTLGTSQTIQPSVNVYLDFALTGEGATGLPTESERNANFTTFLYGRDFAMLVGGNTPVDITSSKLYEMMIAKCGTVTYLVNMASEASRWMKYSNPFRIFNVNNCEVHHPYHYDYSDYTKKLAEKVFPIVYSRKNEALVVLCNESETGGSGELYLNAENLGLPEDLMVYEPLSGTYRRVKNDNGTIQMAVTYPDAWAVDFYVIRPYPKNPKVVWYDVRVWDVNQTWDGTNLLIKTKGMPSKRLPHINVFTVGTTLQRQA